MSEQLREALSALKDGEAEELELRRLLKHGSNPDLDEQWKMMHHLSDAVTGRAPQFAQWDISAKVSAAIADESSYNMAANQQQSAGHKNWFKPVAGFAVAASVAMAVVMGAQTLTMGTSLSGGEPAIASTSSGRVFPANISSSAVGSVNVNASFSQAAAVPGSGLSKAVLMGDLAAEQRLDRYMLQHTEQSALNNGQGMINFARVASFEVE